MYANDIRMLYSQLKACYLREFNDYLVRDDTYIPYESKCTEQKKDIMSYVVGRHYQRLNEVKQDYQVSLAKRADDAALIFNYFGWSDKQIRNIALNYNYDDLKYNVWANQALANQSFEDFGVNTPGGRIGGNFDRMVNEMVMDHTVELQKHLKFDPKKPDSSFLQQTDKFWNPADIPM